MDTHRLKQFCVIAETGSLTKAAQLLHITHSGLSKSMKILQEELKCVLLQPSGRGLSLTDDGVRIYQRAKEFLEHEDRLFKKEKSQNQGSLRIGAVEIFLQSIGDVLKQSNFQNSTITLLDLDPGQMEQMIAAKEIDFGVTYVPFITEDVELVEIGKYYLGCYHLDGAFAGKSFSEIPFVVPAKGLSTNPLGIRERDGWLESLHSRNKKFSVNLLSTALELTLQGHCAIYMPRFAACKINATGKKLVELPLPKKIQKNTHKAFVMRHKNQPADARFRQWCGMVREIIRRG